MAENDERHPENRRDDEGKDPKAQAVINDEATPRLTREALDMKIGGGKHRVVGIRQKNRNQHSSGERRQRYEVVEPPHR